MRTAIRAATALVAGASVGLMPPLAADRVNADWLAGMYARWRPARAASNIALVLLDRRALAHPAFAARPRADWGEPIARLMQTLLDTGVRVLALDVVLPHDDAPALLRVIRHGAREGRLLLGMVAGAGGASPSRAQLAAAGGARVLAAVNLEVDADGRVRALPPTNGGLPAIGAALAARAGVSVTGAARITRGATPALTTWSAADVLDCTSPTRRADAFAGRAVLIGAWLPHEDRHASTLGRLPRAARTLSTGSCTGDTPSFVFDDEAPGVLLHAVAADRWLHRTALMRMPRAAEIALVLLAALAGAGVQRPRGGWALAALALAWTVVAIGAAGAVMLPWLAVSTAAATAAAVAAVLRIAWHATRLAAMVPRAFRATPDATATRTITACFVDIESYTAATEAIADPARVAAELAVCLRGLSDIVERHHGFVDKYLGDGLFALFGVDDGDGRADAVAAASACIAACSGRLRLGGRPLALRIGLATGTARVGTLHGGRRLHFTAVGDPVNVAARLEQLNRTLGTRVLADAGVAAGAPDLAWRDLGAHELRGRRARVRVFELTGSAARL